MAQRSSSTSPGLHAYIDQRGRDGVGNESNQQWAGIAAQLRLLAARHATSTGAMALCSWGVLLGRWFDWEAVAIDVRLGPRLSGRVETTVRLTLGPWRDATVDQLLTQLHALTCEQSISSGMLASAALPREQHVASAEQPTVSLEMSATDDPASQTFHLQCAAGVLAGEASRRLTACWKVLLEDMARRDPDVPVSRLLMLGGQEREQVVHDFNRTTVALADRLVHELVEERARQQPEAIAILEGERRWTMRDVNARANRLARLLRDQGVGPERLVGIFMERSLELVVGYLAVMKAGGAVLPLEPTYPAERLAYMLDDAAPSLLLTQRHLARLLPDAAAAAIVVDGDGEEIAERDGADLPRWRGQTAASLAYVIYTSGSTGNPKGVAAEHRGLVNRIAAQSDIGEYSSTDICYHKTSIGFVDSICEILAPLSYGLPLVLAPLAASRDVRALAATIEARRITRIVTVPSLAQSLLEDEESAAALSSLRCWTLSGEKLEASVLDRLQRRLPRCTFTNIYGSSEVAADATFHVCSPSDRSTVPIGRPIQNMRIYILDRCKQPVPIGVVGELHVAGVGVARGYLNRPELTAQRFLPDPFHSAAGERMFSSGDLALWREDGTIEYLGRSDDQVKIRGIRIEPGEIEAQMLRHASLKRCAVVLRDLPGIGQALVAYVTVLNREAGLVESIRARLLRSLPEYMVPSAIVILAELPTTPSGKIDRRALPMPGPGDFVVRPYEPPRGEVEQILSGIWQQLLAAARVGRNDNFFELGGHSLLVVQMVVRLRQVGLGTDVHNVLMHPTLSELAATLTAHRPTDQIAPPDLLPAEADGITASMLPLVNLTIEEIHSIGAGVPGGEANIQDLYPLTPMQEGMLFHHLLDEQGADTYVVTTALLVQSRSLLGRLVEALQRAVDRHDVLRTAIVWKGLRRPVQVVHRKAALIVEEFSLPAGDVDAAIRAELASERNRMDLQRAPLIRLRVAQARAAESLYVLLQIHHIIDDDVSLRQLISEVLAHIEQPGCSLPEPIPYRNHVAFALRASGERDSEAFFRRKLADVEETTAPFSVFDIRGDGTGIQELRQGLEPELMDRLRAQARRLAVSAATVFHAAWAVVIAHTSARQDVVFGSVLQGRTQSDAAQGGALGMFINTLPLRLQLGGMTARQLVLHTQQELFELLRHEHASLAMAQRCSSVAGGLPLFTAVLNYRRDAVDLDAELAGVDGIRFLDRLDRTNYPITLSVDDRGADVSMVAQTDARVSCESVVHYMHRVLHSLVEALEQRPDAAALRLPILSAQELDRLIRAFNDTNAEYPSGKPIHQLFEERALRDPTAVALVCGESSLSYQALNHRANQLAHYMMERGARAGECIPLVMPRSMELVVAQLAVLKCGGAYIPIDPTLPSERQEFMLRDCGAKLVICSREAFDDMDGQARGWLQYPSDDAALRGYPSSDPGRALHASMPAYVMYTSGSTGAPKGVIIPHHAVNRLVVNSGYADIGTGDVVAHCSNPAFDASVFEVWAGLLNGGCVAIVPANEVLDVGRFIAVLKQRRVTVLFLTIGLFTQYADALGEVLGQLRYLITGGDVVSPAVMGRVVARAVTTQVMNAYGPTECTTFATIHKIDSLDKGVANIPIGRPIANTTIHILDRLQQPVPVGVTGEICIGGAGVALGYLNRAQQTSERFIGDPFSASPGARLYRTGDLGRWTEEGLVEFVGRMDQQVKIRGFRIELGEIEARLSEHSLVKDAVVIVRDEGSAGKRLVAYVTGGDSLAQSIDALREHLQRVLPEYMVPSAIVAIDELPLTANGKLDRRALPAPDSAAYAVREFEAPQGEVEEVVASIWSELLGVSSVGREDSFFDLGGHSLLAMQVIARVRSVLSLEIPIRWMFDDPTLRAFSRHVEEVRQTSLSADLESGENDMDELVRRVSSMSESAVQELVRELQRKGRGTV